MPLVFTKTRTYLGLTGTHASDGFTGLVVARRYTGVPQDDGTVLVAVVGASMGAGVRVSGEVVCEVKVPPISGVFLCQCH